jgi:uncharacterized protein YgiM (DUF1202 family)
MKRHAISTLLICLIFLFALTVQVTALEVKVIKKQVNLREEPDVNSKVLVTVEQGTLLQVKEKINQWYKVVLPNNTETAGYVQQDEVIPQDNQPPQKNNQNNQKFLQGVDTQSAKREAQSEGHQANNTIDAVRQAPYPWPP